MGRSSSTDRLFRMSTRLAPRVYIANLKAGVLISAYLVALVRIPRAIDRLVRWRFVTQAVVIDEATASTATDICTEVTARRWWATLARLVLLRVPTFLLLFLMPAVVALLGGGWALPWAIRLVGLFWPFTVIGQTLIYLDLKVRKAEATVIS